MARGVKKIKMTKGMYYKGKSASLSSQVTIKPDQYASFNVLEWINGTSEEDKKKEITWMRQTNNRKTIISQYKSKNGYKLTISKKFCGPYAYYVEASMSGSRDFKNPSGVYVNGFSEPLIKASDWRTQPKGKDIKNGNHIKYGHLIYLWLDTEGLNGNTITVEIYNQAFGEDDYIEKYTNIKVFNGEVLHKIGNTSKWMSKVKNLQDIEQFYIKAKIGNKYIKDHLGDDKHAIYLNVKGELITNAVEPSTNITPTKVYKAEVNAQRFEPCKFDKIVITIPTVKEGKTETNPITIFEDGKNLKNNKSTIEKINRTIHFKFNDYSIAPKAQKILNNILGFLLEHPGTTIRMSGYACVIGKEDYNQKLSQQRSDAVKDFFASGGLAKDRIISTGRGEYNIRNKDDYKYRNEKVYEDARRVDISFSFSGHTANALVFETIAPTSEKFVTLNITGFDTEDCYRDTKKHKKEVIVKSPDAKEFKGSGTSLRFPIQSILSKTNIAPLNYLWPKYNILNWSEAAAVYNLHVHSCRYYTNQKTPSVLIKAFPDIKWELAFELIIKTSNYKAANMPAGSIYTKHQEKSRKAGYEKWVMNKQGKVPIAIGIGLSAEWDEGKSKRSFTNEFSKKIETLAKVIATSADIVQGAINFAQSAAKQTAIPVGFDVRYPKFTVVGNWFLETNDKNKIAVVGTVGFGFKPLIGAEVIVDIIGAAIAVASYGTTGNPAAARLINKFRGGLETLGAKLVFTATFYGELEMMVDALKITIDGIDMQGKSTIGGKMGTKIELSMALELGKTNATKFVPIDVSFKAAAYAEAYFGGDFVFDSDKKGMFVQPVLKFSGVMLSAEIEGEVGWWKSSFKVEEKVMEEKSHYLEKTYLT